MVNKMPCYPRLMPVFPGCLACMAILACIQPVRAQVSGHQRIGVESRAIWEADIEWSCALRPAGNAGSGLPDLHSSLSLGLLLERKWMLGLEIPVILPYQPGGSASGQFLPGDVSVSIGWTNYLGASRVRGALGLTGPSSLWQGNQEVPGSVATGAGRWSIGLSGGVSRIMDPLVLAANLSWSLGLPRAERWDALWLPGNFSLALSATEVFNEHISCTAVLIQYLNLPEVPWGISILKLPPGSLGYDASARIAFQISGKAFNGGVGFSRSLIHGAEPGSVNLSVGYIFRQRRGP